MNGESLAVLEERTQRLVKTFDEHVIKDDIHFAAVFKMIKGVEIAQAKSGVILAVIVILSQMIVGAWIKGLF